MQHIISQLVKIVDGLKKAGVVHGDIKPENLVVFATENGTYFVKLADFGLAYESNTKPVYKHLVTHWFAPLEAVFGIYSHATDIWSMGCVIYVWIEYCRTDEYQNMFEAKYDLRFLCGIRNKKKCISQTSAYKIHNRLGDDDSLSKEYETRKDYKKVLCGFLLQHTQHHSKQTKLAVDLNEMPPDAAVYWTPENVNLVNNALQINPEKRQLSQEGQKTKMCVRRRKQTYAEVVRSSLIGQSVQHTPDPKSGTAPLPHATRHLHL